jgi:hypothetical protein
MSDQTKQNPKTTGPGALYRVKVSIKKDKLIEQLMDEKEKQATGLAHLKPQELVNLNAWLDTNAVLAPGDQPH